MYFWLSENAWKKACKQRSVDLAQTTRKGATWGEEECKITRQRACQGSNVGRYFDVGFGIRASHENGHYCPPSGTLSSLNCSRALHKRCLALKKEPTSMRRLHVQPHEQLPMTIHNWAYSRLPTANTRCPKLSRDALSPRSKVFHRCKHLSTNNFPFGLVFISKA